MSETKVVHAKPKPWTIEPWSVELSVTQRKQVEQMADELLALLNESKQQAKPLKAYLLFDHWEANQTVAWMEEHFLDVQDKVHAIADPYFEGARGLAPHLFALEDIAPSEKQIGFVYAALAIMWMDAERRLAPRNICAFLLSDQSLEAISDHLVRLAFQHDPSVQDGEDSARMFRYQDPRVMQRVWPLLEPEQELVWLGPIQHWWSFSQNWGPWDSLQQSKAFKLHHPKPQWHKASASVPSDTELKGKPIITTRLFTPQQWQMAHLNPIANGVWNRLAQEGFLLEKQPSTDKMVQMIFSAQQTSSDPVEIVDAIYKAHVAQSANKSASG